MKTPLPKEIFACPRSQGLRGHSLLELFDRITSRKWKVRETVFACSRGTHVESFKQKNNGRKSRDTVPLASFFYTLYLIVGFRSGQNGPIPQLYLIVGFRSGQNGPIPQYRTKPLAKNIFKSDFWLLQYTEYRIITISWCVLYCKSQCYIILALFLVFNLNKLNFIIK